jgi:hypothetical protein
MLTVEIIQESIKDSGSTLKLSFRQLTDGDIPFLVNFLQSNPSITHLDIQVNKLTNVGAIELAKATGLLMIYARENQISNDGAAALARCHNLEELYLADNPIGDPGAIALAKSKSLKKLSLASTQITIFGLQHLLNNPKLKYLDLKSNRFDNDAYQIDASKSRVETLYLNSSRVKDSMIDAIATIPTLIKLNISFNRLSNLTPLSKSPALTTLIAKMTPYDVCGVREILTSRTLKKVVLILAYNIPKDVPGWKYTSRRSLIEGFVLRFSDETTNQEKRALLERYIDFSNRLFSRQGMSYAIRFWERRGRLTESEVNHDVSLT